MANNNTVRVGLYVPEDLKQFFNDYSNETGIKINTLMVTALHSYIDDINKTKEDEKAEFDDAVMKVVNTRLEELGLI